MHLTRAALLAAALGGCSVFDESMRRPKDAGASSPSQTPSGSATSVPSGGCSIDVPRGEPIGACGGAGGGAYVGATETEPNDIAAQMLRRGGLVCGDAKVSDVDRFELAVSAGDCVDVFVDVSGATITVDAPGTKRTLDATTDFGFAAAADGVVAITISGGQYRLVLR